MSNVAVIGSQWGDEGKGKIVDWLSEKADVIVRFQGGHNAGHTLIVDNITYKLNLLPSGVVRKNKISIIGNGVVIDPWALLNEIKEIDKLGVKINNENLYIAENATLILPLHKELDEIREDSKNTDKIGTTRKGIGPAYEDKIGRRGIRVMDLANEKNLSRKKDIIITAGGKNVAPQNIENLLKTSPYISLAMVYGDKKPYLTALVTLDEDEIAKFARDKKIMYQDLADLSKKQEVLDLLHHEISGLNRDLASYETVKKFRILEEELDQDKDEVTPTLKVKRKVVIEHYQDLIKEMYS